MRFYNNMHPYVCGIDLHARSLYVCIIDQQNKVILHKEIPAKPEKPQEILSPYIGNIVAGVESCIAAPQGHFLRAYWVSDICDHIGVDFILGHALHMKAIHGGKAKNDRIDSLKIAKLIKGVISP